MTFHMQLVIALQRYCMLTENFQQCINQYTLEAHRILECHETMAHPSSCCTITTYVCKSSLIPTIRSTERHLFYCLINQQSLDMSHECGMTKLSEELKVLKKRIRHSVIEDNNLYKNDILDLRCAWQMQLPPADCSMFFIVTDKIAESIHDYCILKRFSYTGLSTVSCSCSTAHNL